MNPIKEIKINNSTTNDIKMICDSFNSFFVNIGPNLASVIKPSKNIHYKSFLKKVISSTFHFDLITESDVRDVIKSLKNKESAGYDGISRKLLKLSGPTLSKPLTLILNQSLVTGIFLEISRLLK